MNSIYKLQHIRLLMLLAFDTIDHTILLRKLRIYGVDQNGIKFFESYLSNRSQRCCVNGELSETVKITCGVPHGSNLDLYCS